VHFKKGILSYQEQQDDNHFTSLYANQYKYGLDAYDNYISEPNITNQQENIEFHYVKKYNSMGLQDIELDSVQLKHKSIIIALGDSFTEGNGTPSDSTMPHLLESKLNKNGNYKVINAGVHGSDPIYCYRLFYTQLLRFNPKIVMLTINISDVIDVMCKNGFDRFKDGKVVYKTAPKWEYFYAASRLFRLIVCNIFKYDPYLLVNQQSKNIRYKMALQQIVDCIHDFEALGKKFNFNFVLIYQPHLFDFSTVNNTMRIDYNFENDLKKLYISNKLPDETIFLKDSLIQYHLIDTTRIYNYYWKHDYHFKPVGYDAWANYLYNYFSSKM
jgi:hypothetical protein